MAETYSYAGEIKVLYHCFDPARFLESMLSGSFGNDNVDIETMIRNDNSSVLEHVQSVNSVDKERTTHGFLGSNNAEMDINDWLTLPHIMGGLGISDEMAKKRRRRISRLSYYRPILSKPRAERGECD